MFFVHFIKAPTAGPWCMQGLVALHHLLLAPPQYDGRTKKKAALDVPIILVASVHY